MHKVSQLTPEIELAANKIMTSFKNGGKLLLMGNGGSAADAQHIAAELIGRFQVERQAIPAIALSTDTSVLTALGNDYDYSIVFSRQLEALCQPNDVVIGISTSGNSKNILKGIITAKQKKAFTIGFSGFHGGELAKLVDLSINISSSQTSRIQEAHIFIGHTLCLLIEQSLISKKTSQHQSCIPVAFDF
jgi:D-sedoheptulose 7-phosphate isomerase